MTKNSDSPWPSTWITPAMLPVLTLHDITWQSQGCTEAHADFCLAQWEPGPGLEFDVSWPNCSEHVCFYKLSHAPTWLWMSIFSWSCMWARSFFLSKPNKTDLTYQCQSFLQFSIIHTGMIPTSVHIPRLGIVKKLKHENAQDVVRKALNMSSLAGLAVDCDSAW